MGNNTNNKSQLESMQLEVEIRELKEKLLQREKELNIVKEIEHKNKRNIFDIKLGDTGYYVDELGTILKWIIEKDCDTTKIQSISNISKSKDYTELLSKKQLLQRQMEQFSWENEGYKIDWDNSCTDKWYIYFDFEEQEYFVYDVSFCGNVGDVYFISERLAQKALHKFKPLMEEIRILEEKLKEEYR